jgi:hypothetical protein
MALCLDPRQYEPRASHFHGTPHHVFATSLCYIAISKHDFIVTSKHPMTTISIKTILQRLFSVATMIIQPCTSSASSYGSLPRPSNGRKGSSAYLKQQQQEYQMTVTYLEEAKSSSSQDAIEPPNNKRRLFNFLNPSNQNDSKKSASNSSSRELFSKR